jgi:hypothetical protein
LNYDAGKIYVMISVERILSWHAAKGLSHGIKSGYFSNGGANIGIFIHFFNIFKKQKL